MVSLDQGHHLSPPAERARYEKHQNSHENLGYVQLLNTFADWVVKELKPGAKGLDFGSGPAPVFSQILQGRGLEMKTYDPFFSPDTSPFNEHFDFAVMIEVIEHLRAPIQELQKLRQILKSDGQLFVVTSLLSAKISFPDWAYRRDPTHIAFYSSQTFEWVAKTLNFGSLHIDEPNRVRLTRS